MTTIIDTAIQQVTGFTHEELTEKTRIEPIREARQIAVSFYRRKGFSSVFVARIFNLKHPTPLSTVTKVRDLYLQKCEHELREKIDEVSRLTGIKWYDPF